MRWTLLGSTIFRKKELWFYRYLRVFFLLYVKSDLRAFPAPRSCIAFCRSCDCSPSVRLRICIHLWSLGICFCLLIHQKGQFSLQQIKAIAERMNNSSAGAGAAAAGPSSKVRAAPAQPLEAGFKRKRGVFQKDCIFLLLFIYEHFCRVFLKYS